MDWIPELGCAASGMTGLKERRTLRPPPKHPGMQRR
jgi:hypothetical protein